MIGTSIPVGAIQRPGGWWELGRRRGRMDPGATGPNRGRRRPRTTSRLRRRAPALKGSADRPGNQVPSVRERHRRMWVAPRKVRPFVPADGRSFLDSRAPSAPEPTGNQRTDRCTDPLSLREVHRLSGSADTVLLRRPETPTSRPRSAPSCALTTDAPAFLLESVEGGERLGRYCFLGVGPRRLLTVATASPTTTRPVGVRPFWPDLPETVGVRPARRPAPVPAEAQDPARRRHPAVPRRRRRRSGLRRGFDVRADGAAAGPRPDRDPDGGLPGMRSGPRLRSPDPHPLGGGFASHRNARSGGALRDRRAGDLRGPGANRPADRARAGEPTKGK